MLGMKDFHFHDLRHTFASYLVMNGTDFKHGREILGHKSLDYDVALRCICHRIIKHKLWKSYLKR